MPPNSSNVWKTVLHPFTKQPAPGSLAPGEGEVQPATEGNVPSESAGSTTDAKSVRENGLAPKNPQGDEAASEATVPLTSDSASVGGSTITGPATILEPGDQLPFDAKPGPDWPPNEPTAKPSSPSHIPKSSADYTGSPSKSGSISSAAATEPVKYRRHNVVLPSYEAEMLPDNTVVPESPQKQLLQRIIHMTTSWLWPRSPTDEPRRMSILERLIRTPHTIQKIVVIGVHGWFPGRFLQRVVGEPTGTSGRFAEKMALAVRAYFSEKYNIMLSDDAITMMPLEGEGKIERRVDILHRQLVDSDKGWAKKLLEADMVFVAAHSQGVPVSTILLSRLIKEGRVDPSRQKVAFLAMAGISHGPHPFLKANMIVKYFEADAARELFEFNDPNTEIAKKYQIAMRYVLAHGIRAVAVGSWYDQVVPLYSAVMHGFRHPNIYRALYIDGADYIPDFLSHLVVFGLKLQNAGVSDHNLIVHLSDVLTGTLFGTQGHSVIYEEINTYLLAVAWAMGGKPAWSIPASPSAPWGSNMMVSSSLSAPTRLNPYYLPWIMARLIDDPFIQANEDLQKDLDALMKMFENWEPSSKQLKEMRYRLEPIRSRL
ncbi:uncharacterized protein EV422DRAFT_563820 [Fimicolochytrium jonesii]|uniref:uncharacterized protein n=1 Tax=Fimicolochytrium jonesii TaxID=1396493 RepID=UPI0022FE1717|nr:uncharacterized protein EV422DRAFT_563820 [Fimicolochytrium jonesii]KAI8826005.1 hypothetical protein EV422DRAFT_563820 [Fimicolochytrium jonesii]